MIPCFRALMADLCQGWQVKAYFTLVLVGGAKTFREWGLNPRLVVKRGMLPTIDLFSAGSKTKTVEFEALDWQAEAESYSTFSRKMRDKDPVKSADAAPHPSETSEVVLGWQSLLRK